MKNVKRLCVSTPGYLAKKKKQKCPSKVTGQEYSGAVWGRHVHILIIDPLLSPCNSNLRTLLISFQKFQIRSNFFLSIMQSWMRSLGAEGKHTCLNRCSVGQFLTPCGRRECCLYTCEHLLFHKIMKNNIREKEPYNVVFSLVKAQRALHANLWYFLSPLEYKKLLIIARRKWDCKSWGYNVALQLHQKQLLKKFSIAEPREMPVLPDGVLDVRWMEWLQT